MTRVLAVVFASAAVLALGAAGPPDPFKGRWVGTDPVDGSTQQVSFGGTGDTRNVQVHDDDATVACEGGGSATIRATGTVTVPGEELFVEGATIKCPNGEDVEDVNITFTFDPDTGELTDDITCDEGECITYTRP